MQENGIRKAVREGRVAIGQIIREFDSRGLPFLMAHAGLDYMLIDLEHGSYSIESIASLVGWYKATSVSPMVRLHKDQLTLAEQLLDVGVMGFQVSSIETVEEARALADLTKYPPIGNRGISMMGSHTDYGGFSKEEYAPWANENIIIGVGLESLTGLDNVREIAAVDGIDMISIGYSDLSARMGIHLDLDHPRFQEVLHAVSSACKAHGKLGRVYPQTDAHIEQYYKMGFQIFGLKKTDLVLYRDALKADADYMRSRLERLGVPSPKQLAKA